MMTPSDLKQQIVSLFDICDWNYVFVADPERAVLPYRIIDGTVRDVRRRTQCLKSNPLLPAHLESRTFLDRAAISCGYYVDAEGDEEYRNLLACCMILSAQASVQSRLLEDCRAMIRGSLVRGDYFCDGCSAVGGALETAHVINEDIGVAPRIAVSKDFRMMFQRTLDRNPTFDGSVIDDVFMKDEDGLTFINYLSAQFLDGWFVGGGSNLLKVEAAVDRHRAAIIQMIRENRVLIYRDPSFRERFGWLIKYHNRYVEQYGIGKPINGAFLYEPE